jgi:hypothetical protein
MGHSPSSDTSIWLHAVGEAQPNGSFRVAIQELSDFALPSGVARGQSSECYATTNFLEVDLRTGIGPETTTELAAAAGEDGWTAGETCPLLLAAVGGEPSNERVVWQYAPADSRAVPSGGIAEALGSRKLDREPPGAEGCRRKPDGKAAVSSFGTRGEADRTLSQAPGPAKEQLVRWNPSRGVQSGAVGS